MSTDNALAIYQQFDTMQRAAVVLVESGFFKDVQSKAQAIVKVMAGAELGLPPFASMTGIAIIQGKPVLGANLIATLVKNDPRYDYRPVEHTDTACVIEWREKGKVVGQSAFTWEEATRAGLTGKDNWRKYPSDMLFARAISRGARRFAPGIFGGSPIYTPDELGADVDEDGNVVEGEIVHSVPVNRQPPPLPPVKAVPAGLNPETGEVMDEELFPAVPESLRRKFHAVGGKCYGDEWDDQRARLVSSITKGKSKSSNDLSREQMEKLIDGMEKKLAQQLLVTDAHPVDAGYAE